MTSLRRWIWAAFAAVALGAAPQVANAAKERLVIDLVGEPSTLDPQLQWNPDSYYVYRNIFDNLVTRDDEGAIAPEVATSWRRLSDAEIEFTIRDDILFHDGEKLTAEDVAFSVRRIIDPAFASPQRGQFDKIVKAEATAPNRVKLTTQGPYPLLLAQLVKLSIVPKHVVEAAGKDQFNLKPVGSGPYVFKEWRRGAAVELIRNDRYWSKKGPFAQVVFRTIPDAATRLANLQSGASDLAIGLDSDLAEQLEKSGRGKRLSVRTERLSYLRLNPYRAPFDNPKIREAVARAIDKEGVVSGILGGYDLPIGQMLTPAHFGWTEDVKGVSFDPARAKELVKEAGDAARAEITLTTAPFFDRRVTQAVQQMLVEIGLNVKIEQVDTANFLQRIQRGPRESPLFATVRLSCACQDADGALYSLFHSGDAWTIIENPDLDQWLDHARSTLDEKARLADYANVNRLIEREIPVVPLFQGVAHYGAAKPLQWKPTPNESLFVNRMTWTD